MQCQTEGGQADGVMNSDSPCIEDCLWPRNSGLIYWHAGVPTRSCAKAHADDGGRQPVTQGRNGGAEAGCDGHLGPGEAEGLLCWHAPKHSPGRHKASSLCPQTNSQNARR